LLTGGADKPYALGLLETLVTRGLTIDVIGSDEMSGAAQVAHPQVRFLNFRGNQDPTAPVLRKIVRILRYYGRLIKYALTSESKLFHILWLDRFAWIDRTLIIIYYRLLGKKILYTAHNINERKRDGGDSLLNRASLRGLYGLVDHIFVHSAKMKTQLRQDFRVNAEKISVIPFGINNTLPRTAITSAEAKARLGLRSHDKGLLFFGNIAPYKGLESALAAMDLLTKTDGNYRLIISGQIKDCPKYWARMEQMIESLSLDPYLIRRIQYIPDEDVEIFFKAADVLVLPYKFIYQSGVLFLSYSFGLPVIATNVGSLEDEILEGRSGMICRSGKPEDLADRIRTYFNSGLYRNLDDNRKTIIDFGNKRYSWDQVGAITCSIYEKLGARP
jgi:D-inositol-3-phosphate glycosyltransferase